MDKICSDKFCFSNPYVELAYKIVERAIKDSKGQIINPTGKTREEKAVSRKRIMAEASAWIRERNGDFDYYCDALGIDANDKRERLGIISEEK